jgi:hypothetical protein
MSQQSNVKPHDEHEVPAELKELVEVVLNLPIELRTQLSIPLQRVVDGVKRRRRILGLVQDALSQLRLDMKYLVFDLEATRRERDDYRQRLEQS